MVLHDTRKGSAVTTRHRNISGHTHVHPYIYISTNTHKVVVPLDDLQEESGSVLHRFGEDLEQVALIIKIH